MITRPGSSIDWRGLGKHPVLHFLLIGCLLFGLNALRQDGGPSEDDARVFLDRPRLVALAGIWKAQFGRGPTEAELTSVARAWATEEIKVREARRMGLDRDDSVIRRRLAQKYDFLINNPANAPTPSDDVLRRYLTEHPERYAGPSRYSFDHVFFSSDRGQKAAFKAAQQAMAHPEAARGDVFPGDRVQRNATEPEVRQDFGSNFAAALPRLKPGIWEGPVESGFGFHIVRITARKALAPPNFAEVRGQILADWLVDSSRDAAAKADAALEKRYRVVLDPEAVRAVAGKGR